MSGSSSLSSAVRTAKALFFSQDSDRFIEIKIKTSEQVLSTLLSLPPPSSCHKKKKKQRKEKIPPGRHFPSTNGRKISLFYGGRARWRALRLCSIRHSYLSNSHIFRDAFCSFFGCSIPSIEQLTAKWVAGCEVPRRANRLSHSTQSKHDNAFGERHKGNRLLRLHWAFLQGGKAIAAQRLGLHDPLT